MEFSTAELMQLDSDDGISTSDLMAMERKPLTDEATFKLAGQSTNENIERRMRNASTIAATNDITEREAYDMHDVFVQKYGEANLWDKASGSFKAGAGDVYSMVGGLLKRKGVGQVADNYIDFGERLKRAYIPPEDQSEFRWRKMLDPEWYATTVTRSVPFTLSLVPAAIVGAYAGAGVGTLAGLGMFGKVVLGSIGGAMLSRPLESAFEAQGAYEEAKEKGFAEEDAESAADQVFWANMKLVAADAAQFATAFVPMGRILGDPAKRILAKRIAATAGRVGAVGLMEAGEERYQEKSVLDAVGDFTSFFDFGNPRLNEASAAGAVFGVGLGGAGSVWNALRKNVVNNVSDDLAATYADAHDSAIKEGATPEAADLAGLDAIADTPEGRAHIEKFVDNLKRVAAGEDAAVQDGESFVLDLDARQEVDVDTLIDDFITGDTVEDSALDAFIEASVGVVKEDAGQSILDKAKSVNDSIGEKGSIDIEPLVDLGKSIWSEGHTTIEAFTARAKELLSSSWEKVKDFISQAWESVKAFNAQLGERGSIGGEKKEAIKTTIHKATGQRTVANMVREDVALRAGLMKSAQAARVAMREGKTEGVAQEKSRMKAMIAAAKQRAVDKLAEKSVVKDIQKIAAMKGNIAVDYQKRTAAILSGLDFKKPTDQKLKELRSLREFIEKDGVPLGINQKHLNELARLEKVPLRDMTAEDKKALRDTLKHLEKMGKLKAELKMKYDERQREKALNALIVSSRNVDPKVKDIKDKTGREKIRLAMKQAYLATLHTPRVAEMLDGYKQGENYRYIKELSNAETKAVQEAEKKKIAFLEDLQALGIDTISDEMEIRMMMVMREREGARSQVEALLKHYKMDAVPTLTAQEEAIIEKIKEYINAQKNDLAAVMEEITGEIFPEMETYYLPMKYERDDQLIPDSSVQGGFRTTHTFDGFRHARRAGVTKVPRVDIVNIFSEAIDEQFWYMRMQPQLENLRPLVLSDEYRQKAGEMAQNWWRDEIDIIARRGWSNSARNTAMSAGLRQVRQNLNQSILLFKLSTIMLQPFAVFDAMAYVNSKFGPTAAAGVLAETTKTVFIPGAAKEYIKTSPALQQRQGGELAITENLAAMTGKTRMDKAAKLGFSMIMRTDVNTAAGVQKAVEKILIKEGVSNAKAEAEFIMNLTNGSANVTQRPHILSIGEGARMWFTFQSFFLNRWGVIAHDLVMSGFVKSDTYRAKFLSLISLGIMMMAGALEDEMRKKLIELTTGKEWKMKDRGFVIDGIVNLLSTMPFFGSFINSAATGLSSAPPAVRTTENLVKGIGSIMTGKDGETKAKGAMRATEAGLALFIGLPGTAQAFDLLEGVMFEN